MTGAKRAAEAARIAAASVMIAGGALGLAGQAAADPEPLPIPAPSDPGAPAPVPGVPAAPLDGPVGPPPAGPPPVPEIANPVYGSGKSSGPLGFLRDAWHQAKDPYMTDADDPNALPSGLAGPPPGAGPAPALPPGYISLNAPGSETAAPAKAPGQTGPALPPGYYPLNGPPPPGYAPAGAPAPAAGDSVPQP